MFVTAFKNKKSNWLGLLKFVFGYENVTDYFEEREHQISL